MHRLLVFILGIVILCLFTSLYAYAPFARMLCKSPGFNCLHIGRHQTWETLFPDDDKRMMVMQLNRMNTPLYAGMLIAVPNNLDQANLMDFSPFPAKIKPTGQKIIFVNPNVLAWGAYTADGHLVRWGPASLGSNWCQDLGHRCHSPVGIFHIFSKGTFECKSKRFPLPDGGAPMPYCMYFYNGFALHGEPGGLPGDNASHGCVRLFVADAQWLNNEFVEFFNSNSRGTKVVIEPYGNTYFEENGKKHSHKTHRYYGRNAFEIPSEIDSLPADYIENINL